MATMTNQGILLASGTNELEIIEIYIDEKGGARSYFGINVAKIREIINMPERLSSPPNAASIVAGVFDHRGQVIMLVDLAKWLEVDQEGAKKPIVVVTEFNQTTLGFLVSGITRIHRTRWDEIRPLDGYLQGLCHSVTGVILLEGRIVLMLDLERALAEIDPEKYAPAQQKRDSLESAIPFGEPVKILHADDSQIIRKSIKDQFENSGEFAVSSYVDGKQAWERLVEIKSLVQQSGAPLTDYVDVILSDIEMPQMDGYHLCHRIKSDPVLKQIPVILFSSLITDTVRHKGKSVGADAQYAKPSRELIENIRALTGR